MNKAQNYITSTAHPLLRRRGCPGRHGVRACHEYPELTEESRSHNQRNTDNQSVNFSSGLDTHNTWLAKRGYPLRDNLDECAFADYLKPAVIVSLNTGLRRGELFLLEWQDIELELAMLTVRKAAAKSGKTRHVPLNQTALDCLKQWRSQTQSQTLVFRAPHGGSFHDVNSAWRRVLKAAKIENFRWHDLRHTFASRLVMHGVDLNTARELLGHADLKMTLRYAHLAPQRKAAAVAMLDTPAGENIVEFPEGIVGVED